MESLRANQSHKILKLRFGIKTQSMLTNIKLPITKFDSESASWVEIELPNLEVNGKFFIHVYTGNL